MSSLRVVALGWQAVTSGVDKAGRRREIKLSRVYTSKQLATQFAELASRPGHCAWVREISGVDDAGDL